MDTRRPIALLSLLLALLVAPAAAAFKFEVGAFTIAATSGASPSFTTRNFQQVYPVPPVVIVLATNQGDAGAMVRVRNVGTSSFQAVVVESPGLDGPHSAMDVHYLAIEPGVHTMTVIDQVLGSRSITIEAGRLSTGNIIACTAAPSACTGSYASHGFASSFTTQPVLLAELQTFVNGASGVPPAPPVPFISVAVNAVTASGFDYAIDRHEVTAGSLSPAQAAQEEIGYVALPGDVTAADFNANDAAQVLVELETIHVAATAANAALGFGNPCNRNIDFSTSLSTRHVVAGKLTRRENDGGWLRRCELTATRVRLQVDDDSFGDAENSKTLADGVGVVVASQAFFYDSSFVVRATSPDFKVEADSFTLTPGTPATVTLRQFYALAPAVFLFVDSSNPEPTAVRVTNVSTNVAAGTTQFTAVAIEPQGGVVPTSAGGAVSTVHYIAIDKGQFHFPDGTAVEVGEVSISARQQGFTGTDSLQTVNLSHTFAAPPVVLAQLTGDLNTPGNPALPWLTVAHATNSTTTTAFSLALERSEVNAGTVASAEVVAYLAIDAGVIGEFRDGAGNLVEGEAQRAFLNGTANAGWTDICFDNAVPGIPFLNTYDSPPLVVAHEMSHISGDGGWQRRCNLTSSHVRIAEDEDQFQDAERTHPREETGLVAFSRAFDADFSFVAWYRMEEGVWNDGAPGQVQNSVGSALTGTPRDGAQTVLAQPAFVAGTESTCRYGEFDGQANVAGVPDSVDLGNGDLELRNRLSVSTWIRWSVAPTAGNARAVYVQNDRASDFNNVQFALRGSINNRRFEFTVRTTTGNTTAVTPNLIVANTWYHVTGVYDGASVRIFVDGTAHPSIARSGNVVAHDAERRLNLARSEDSASNYHGFRGQLDEVRIYRRALSAAEIARIRTTTRPCGTTYDHYALTHVGVGGGYGVTCEPESITVSAHDALHDVSTPPSGTQMTITASPGDAWTLGALGNPGSFTALGGGAAQYVWNGGEAAIELRLARAAPAVVTFDISDSNSRGRADGEDMPLEFRDAVLRFAEGNAPIGTPAGVQIAGRPQAFRVQVLENDGNGACQAANPPPGFVDFAFECLLPATGCSGLTAGSVEGESVPAFDSGTATPSTEVKLGFNAEFIATFMLAYHDAGQVSLKAQASFGTPLATVAGATGPFVVRPFALQVAAERANGTANPAASDAGGGVFVRAGEVFTVDLTPVAWQAADDNAPADGVADGHQQGEQEPLTRANLADNPTLRNYYTSAPDGTAVLGSYLYRPAGGNDPGLADDSATPLRAGPFAGAPASATGIHFDEVGIIEIEAVQGGDYLGIGAAETALIRGVSGAVGRFIPGYFAVDAVSGFELRNGLAAQSWTCAFTYTGQPFEYAGIPVLKLSARSTRGQATRNYVRAAAPADDFFKLTTSLAGRSYDESPPAAALAEFSLYSAPAAATLEQADDFDGSFALHLAGEQFVFAKGSAPETPFEPELRLTVPAADLTDSDGVCHPGAATLCNTADADTAVDYVKDDITTGGVELRFGRLVVSSATGSELLPLALPARVEYFANQGGGGAFIANADDAPDPNTSDCSRTGLAAAVRLTGGAGEQSGDTFVPLIGSGGVSVLIDPVGGAPPAPDLEFTAGLANLTFAPPVPSPNSGFIDVRIDLALAGQEWLRHDWDGDGSFDDDPVARASFGLFGGRRELIYIREPWD